MPTGPLVALGERLGVASLQEAATRGRALRGAAARAGRRGRDARRRAGGGAAPARRRGGRGPARGRRRPASAPAAIDVERARLEAEADEARRRLEEAGAEPAEGDDREELAERIERLERRRETLGQVNPLAKEEYDAREGAPDRARRRSAPTSRRASKELEQLRAELTETVERRFDETFAAVERALRRGRRDALPGRRGPAAADRARGGRARSRASRSSCGRRGKRVTRLSLLSGGEKALGAISFLFALFLARPCPFYLLDEVEAALDDTNIGRFVELLRRYSDSAQFIVVTHQKKTMEAADVLYGVTMGGDGVSQIVSRRLPRDEHASAVA